MPEAQVVTTVVVSGWLSGAKLGETVTKKGTEMEAKAVATAESWLGQRRARALSLLPCLSSVPPHIAVLLPFLYLWPEVRLRLTVKEEFQVQDQVKLKPREAALGGPHKICLEPVGGSNMTSIQVLTAHDLTHGWAEPGTRCTSGLLAGCINDFLPKLQGMCLF
jgi:hypothetical protein